MANQIKCMRCKVPLQGLIVDGKPKGKFSCPRCGRGDTYPNILREIGEQAKEKAADKITGAFERATRGSKSLTFKKSRRPKKVYRFTVDL